MEFSPAVVVVAVVVSEVVGVVDAAVVVVKAAWAAAESAQHWTGRSISGLSHTGLKFELNFPRIVQNPSWPVLVVQGVLDHTYLAVHAGGEGAVRCHGTKPAE